MSGFDDRERQEESKFKHDQELNFKVRNRRNKLFGIWLAENHLGMAGDAVANYAKEVVMSDFEAPGDDDVIEKVKADLAKASTDVSDHILQAQLEAFEAEARKQVMSE
jgi:hypothetical protein